MDEVIFFLAILFGFALIAVAFYKTYLYGYNDGYAEGFNNGYRESEHYEPRSDRLDRMLGRLARQSGVSR